MNSEHTFGNNTQTSASADTNTEKTSFSNFISNIPWKYVIIGIIVVLIILSIVQVINALANISKPFTDAFGSAANSAASILNNCVPQSDCTKIGNCDQCKNTTGCSCTADQKGCQIISGRNAGDGGFFTPSCGLGIGFIIYGLGSLFLAVLSVIAGWKASPAVEATAKAEGKPANEVAKELTNETKAEVDRIEEEHEKTTGEKLSPDGKTLVEKTVAQSKLADRQYKAAEKLPSTADKTSMEKESSTKYANEMKEIDEEKSKLSEKEKETVDKATEENKPEFEEPKE